MCLDCVGSHTLDNGMQCSYHYARFLRMLHFLRML